MRKEYDSGLDESHHFVLVPLGRIGPCFRASELVDLALWHILNAVLVSAPGLWIGRWVQGVCEICPSRSAASRLMRQSVACECKSDNFGLNVRVEGQMVFNIAGLLLQGALRGLGLAYLTEGHVQPYVSEGRLVPVLTDWCPPLSGYHLYYPSRRQPSQAFTLLVEALRYRGK